MTILVLPIAYVYCELSALLPHTGAELVYNTVGINKHAGFWSTWLILAAWIAVPPAAVMGILDWINHLFQLNMSFQTTVILGSLILVVYCMLSLYEISIAGGIQTFMLFSAFLGLP